MLGEIIAWRNLFWAMSDAMAMNPVPWVGGAVLPNAQSGTSYRVFAGDAYRPLSRRSWRRSSRRR